MQLSIPARLALAVAGASFAVAGTVLGIRAAWGAIALTMGPIWASAIIGAGLVTLGAIMAAMAGSSKRKAPPPSPQTAMVGAFFEGLRAGRASRGHGH